MSTRTFTALLVITVLVAALLAGCGQREREAFALARGEGTYEAYLRFATEYPGNEQGQYALAVVGLVTGHDPQEDPALQKALEAAPEKVRNGYELRDQYRAAVAQADGCTRGCGDKFIDCSLKAHDASGKVDYAALDACTKGLEPCQAGCAEAIAQARDKADIYTSELGLIEHDASLTILQLEREPIEAP